MSPKGLKARAVEAPVLAAVAAGPSRHPARGLGGRSLAHKRGCGHQQLLGGSGSFRGDRSESSGRSDRVQENLGRGDHSVSSGHGDREQETGALNSFLRVAKRRAEAARAAQEEVSTLATWALEYLRKDNIRRAGARPRQNLPSPTRQTTGRAAHLAAAAVAQATMGKLRLIEPCFAAM